MTIQNKMEQVNSRKKYISSWDSGKEFEQKKTVEDGGEALNTTSIKRPIKIIGKKDKNDLINRRRNMESKNY